VVLTFGSTENIACNLQLLGDACHAGPRFDMANVRLGVLGPDEREHMIEHARVLAAAKVPFIFDPGEALPLFSRADLERFLAQATWVIVNEHAWQLLQEKTGCTANSVLEQIDALIVTLGARGSRIHTRQGTIPISAATPRGVVDTTGCGDAYRAGLIHGLLHRLDWETAGEIASLMAAMNIESAGPQSHPFTRREFRQRFKENFGSLHSKRRAF
jgi:adenosine kinase